MSKLREAQAFFGERAQDYRQSPSHANAQELARMIAWTRPRPGALALDVATGGGHTARALAQAGAQVVATDATRNMLADLSWPALLCDAHALPVRDARCDLVATRIAPHHFTQLQRFAAEVARVLRPGGKLYVFDLTTPEEPEAARIINRIETLRDPSHVNSYPPSAWREALDAAGLRVERMETSTSTLPVEPWIARARLPPERERELRALLQSHPTSSLGGYGLKGDGMLAVLRVEILAVRDA